MRKDDLGPLVDPPYGREPRPTLEELRAARPGAPVKVLEPTMRLPKFTLARGDETLEVCRLAFVVRDIAVERKGTGMRVVIRATVAERQSGAPLQIVQCAEVSDDLPFALAVRQALIETFAHEVDECLLRDGVPVRDPHGGSKEG